MSGHGREFLGTTTLNSHACTALMSFVVLSGISCCFSCYVSHFLALWFCSLNFGVYGLPYSGEVRQLDFPAPNSTQLCIMQKCNTCWTLVTLYEHTPIDRTIAKRKHAINPLILVDQLNVVADEIWTESENFSHTHVLTLVHTSMENKTPKMKQIMNPFTLVDQLSVEASDIWKRM